MFVMEKLSQFIGMVLLSFNFFISNAATYTAAGCPGPVNWGGFTAATCPFWNGATQLTAQPAVGSILVIPAGCTVILNANVTVNNQIQLQVLGTLKFCQGCVSKLTLNGVGSSVVVGQGGVLSSAGTNNGSEIKITGATQDVWQSQNGTSIGGAPTGFTLTGTGTDCYINASNQLTGGNCGAGTLPIELVSFEVHDQSKFINCHWITATELNNDFFTIERSNNAINFEAIAQVKGAGNSTTLLNYYFLDENPLNGISYYRLRQTDYNGTQSISNIISIEKLDSDEIKFDVYPNPNDGDNFSIITENKNPEIVDVNITDALGNIIYSSFHTSNSNGKISIKTSPKLASGIYFVKLSTSKQKNHTCKLIVN